MTIIKHKKVMTGIYPTPLHKLNNLTESIGKAEIFIKRDDMTGFAFGGNKLRKLDYIVADAKDKGCTTLLTYGGVQTNHGRLTAAAASMFNMKSVIMCYGEPPEYASGNLLLDRMLGAEVYFMDTTAVRKLPSDKIYEGYMGLKKRSTDAVIEQYEKNGEKVYIVPIGGHSVVGTIGYIDAVKEMMDQLSSMGEKIDYLVCGLGSGGTFAGLWLGAKYHGADFEVIGATVADKSEKEMHGLVDFMNTCNKELELGLADVKLEDLNYVNDCYGEGYNIPDEQTRKNMYMLAQKEGIMVDPCYTGKTFSALLNLVEKEIIPSTSKVLYLHTGGTPGIYTKEHADAMQEELWNNPTIFR